MYDCWIVEVGGRIHILSMFVVIPLVASGGDSESLWPVVCDLRR